MKPCRKIAICGNFGVSNIGDEAILRSLKFLVAEIFPHSEAVVMGLGSLFPFGCRSFVKASFLPQKWIVPYRKIKSCDIFILSGGLFTDEEGYFVSAFWALHGLTAYLLKKPVLCLGVSIGDIHIWNRWLVKKLFRISQVVAVRDKKSFDLLQKWGIKNIKLLSDICLAGPFNSFDLEQKTNYLPKNKSYIVIIIRRFKNYDKKLYTILAQFCDAIFEKYGLYIRLIPFQKGADFDEYILNKIFDQCKHKNAVIFDKFHENLEELLNALSNAEVVIGMRLHACILSLITETPFIPINYMQKVSDFWSEFSEIKQINLKNFDLEGILSVFDKIFRNKQEFRNTIKHIKHILVKRSLMIKEILQALK